MEFWTGDKIRSYNANYNIIFGERSNGKTYDTIKYALDQYLDNGSEFIIMRRNSDEITASFATQFLKNHDGYLKSKLGDGAETSYYSGKFYLYRDKINAPKDKEIIGYTMSVSGWTKYKGAAYPKVGIIILDEFLTTHRYVWENPLKPLQEFNDFINNVSTVTRCNDEVKIYLLGNTVTRYSPYFDGFGIDPFTIKKGEIITYKTKQGALIAVEHCKGSGVKKSDKLLDFGSTGKMVVNGEWEINSYPAAWRGIFYKDMLKFRSYKEGVKIRLKQGSRAIGCIVPVKLEHPIILLDKIRRWDVEADEIKQLAYYEVLKDLLNFKLAHNAIISESDYATEIFLKKLKK